VRDFALVESDFTIENGMLTPSQKLKRRKVLEVYGDVLDRIYGARSGGVAGSLRSTSPT